MTLNDIRDLENEVKVTRFYTGLRFALVPLCTKFSETSSNISLDIKQKPFQMTVNDFSNHENKVKVKRFEHGLCLALAVLCTKFCESPQILLQILSRNNF